MGATYISFQAGTEDREGVLTFSRGFVAAHPHEFRCYVGEPLGAWTAVYPSLSPVMDLLAKELSRALGCVVLSLVSHDEDEVLCNFCEGGKDHSFFKISTGRRRPPKQRGPVAKRLSLLAAYLDDQKQAELLAYLSDTTAILDSGEILKTFCQAVGIRNAMTSYDNIEHGDYQADLDTAVELVKVG
jgi:hypothetical protein